MARKIKRVTYTTPPYESLAMLHPDGTLMCRTSTRKANWYLERGLAEQIDDTTFQLKFEPNGHGFHDKPFYLEIKENKCVVCGREDDLSRHHIVPYQFRSLFPSHMKSHDHHDVALLCRSCHDEYEKHADKFKIKLLADMGYVTAEANRIKTANRRIFLAKETLQKKLDAIPPKRLEWLRSCAEKEIVPELDWKELFLRTFNTSDLIDSFCIVWRVHFLEYAKPKFLSEHFDIGHRHEQRV